MHVTELLTNRFSHTKYNLVHLYSESMWLLLNACMTLLWCLYDLYLSQHSHVSLYCVQSQHPLRDHLGDDLC